MNSDHKHLEKLLDSYFDQSLDEAERKDLNQQLIASAPARTAFWERVAIENTLECWAEKERGNTLALEPVRPTSTPHFKITRTTVLGSVAALLVTCFAFLWFSGGPRDTTTAASRSFEADVAPNKGPGSQDTAVACVARAHGVPRNGPFEAGRSIVAGREIRIPGGYLELEFYSGASVFLEGPAAFDLESDMRLNLKHGKIHVVVSESAKGFQVGLPDGTVTDLGTRFEVEVEGDKTKRLQVITGSVELAATGSEFQVRRLLAGEAVTLAEAGTPKTIAMRPFAIKDTLEKLAEANDRKRQAIWNDFSNVLAGDPSLLVHFRFLPDEFGSKEIINRAHGSDSPRFGTIISAKWGRGRWNGKPALSFRNPNDRVRLEVPGEHSAATLMAWVKVDGLPRRYNGLFLSEHGIQGEAHWQLYPSGQMIFSIRPKETRSDWKFHRALSEPIILPHDFGVWRLLASSYDSTRREVTHYIDGVLVSSHIIDQSIPLRFGRATLGNFFDPKATEHASSPGLGEEWSHRNWTGEIDEFMLFNRVLDPDEIQRIHEAGMVRD